MTIRDRGINRKRRSHSKKTKKRLAIKLEMLARKAAKRHK